MRPHPIFFIVICLVFSAGWPGAGLAQTAGGYESISTAQGLSQGLINDMIQDRDGFIWIATKGGLNRYDGYGFKIFTSDPTDTNTISSNAVSTLLEDKRGRIWVGTSDGGVNVYDKKSGKFLRIVQKPGDTTGISSNRIESDMTELPDGRILVNPQGGSLSIIALSDGGRPVISSLSMSGGRTVKWIYKDDKDYIWLDCNDNNIFIFDPITKAFELLYDGSRFTSLIHKTGKIFRQNSARHYSARRQGYT